MDICSQKPTAKRRQMRIPFSYWCLGEGFFCQADRVTHLIWHPPPPTETHFQPGRSPGMERGDGWQGVPSISHSALPSRQLRLEASRNPRHDSSWLQESVTSSWHNLAELFWHKYLPPLSPTQCGVSPSPLNENGWTWYRPWSRQSQLQVLPSCLAHILIRLCVVFWLATK